MKKEVIDRMPTNELREKETKLKMSTGLLIGMLLVLYVVTIFNTIQENKIDPILLVAIALSVIAFRNYKILSNITKEICNRSN